MTPSSTSIEVNEAKQLLPAADLGRASLGAEAGSTQKTTANAVSEPASSHSAGPAATVVKATSTSAPTAAKPAPVPPLRKAEQKRDRAVLDDNYPLKGISKATAFLDH